MSHLYFYTSLSAYLNSTPPHSQPPLPFRPFQGSTTTRPIHQPTVSTTFVKASPRVLKIPLHVLFWADQGSIAPISNSSHAAANHCVQPSSSEHTPSSPHWIFLGTTWSQHFKKEWLTSIQKPVPFQLGSASFSKCIPQVGTILTPQAGYQCSVTAYTHG